jgi:NAD(P)-dependent dehydrogenase (short-subunit alcohol dehydrogenase family)
VLALVNRQRRRVHLLERVSARLDQLDALERHDRIGASQLAPYNINVNAICPGATRSEMYDTIMRQIVERENITEAEAMSRMDVSIPLRRSNTGDDIANMTAFLASEEARNITGQSLNVDGGLIWD